VVVFGVGVEFEDEVFVLLLSHSENLLPILLQNQISLHIFGTFLSTPQTESLVSLDKKAGLPRPTSLNAEIGFVQFLLHCVLCSLFCRAFVEPLSLFGVFFVFG
jgi:hypothetical protein